MPPAFFFRFSNDLKTARKRPLCFFIHHELVFRHGAGRGDQESRFIQDVPKKIVS
jgi:hypothetical protein